jgi:hypothetical protein
MIIDVRNIVCLWERLDRDIYLKLIVLVAFAVVVISGFVPWASSERFWWNPLIYYLNISGSLNGLIWIRWLQGDYDIVIAGLVMLVTYFLGVLFGALTFFSGVYLEDTIRYSREAGVFSITSGLCWIYVVLRNPYGLGGWWIRANLDIGTLLIVIGGVIFLAGYYFARALE